MVISLVINGDAKISIWIWQDVNSGFVSGFSIGKREYFWGKSKQYNKVFRIRKN